MSSGREQLAEPVSSLDNCAPLFRRAVLEALDECHVQGLDAMVYESTRTDYLQDIYWRRGREQDTDGSWHIIDPDKVVTRAQTAQYGWHFFGLAIDVISKRHRWSVSAEWRRLVTEIFERHGLDAGMRWPHPDDPHYHWGRCKRSPSGSARYLYRQGGNPAVWKAVGAA